MVSNLLDIDFIHSDIHGLLCAKKQNMFSLKSCGYDWLHLNFKRTDNVIQNGQLGKKKIMWLLG